MRQFFSVERAEKRGGCGAERVKNLGAPELMRPNDIISYSF